MHNLSHLHVDEEVVEATLAISSLRSGNDLPDLYKDHPLQKSSIDEETPMPYPQALSKPKGKVSQSDDHLFEAFQKVTITIPLVDAIKNIPSYAHPIEAPRGSN